MDNLIITRIRAVCARMHDATKGDAIVGIVIETERRKVMGCVTGAWKRGTRYKMVKLHGMGRGTKSRKKNDRCDTHGTEDASVINCS